jgi:predicted ATPase
VTLDDLVRNARFTVLLGKNGSGKSTLLRKLDSSETFGTKYISRDVRTLIDESVDWLYMCESPRRRRPTK